MLIFELEPGTCTDPGLGGLLEGARWTKNGIFVKSLQLYLGFIFDCVQTSFVCLIPELGAAKEQIVVSAQAPTAKDRCGMKKGRRKRDRKEDPSGK